MLKHVLVPLDGSKLAEEALAHAVNLVEPKGKISLISAVEVPDVPIYGYYPPATIPDYQEAKNDLLPYAKNYLEGIAGTLGAQYDVTITTEAEIGNPADLITRKAQQYHVDAIVMSTHGRSGLSRWLFGSVTSKVLSAKACPVYVVPSHDATNGKH